MARMLMEVSVELIASAIAGIALYAWGYARGRAHTLRHGQAQPDYD